MDLPPRPILTVVLDVAAFGAAPAGCAAALFAAGADWIQLRDRAVEDATLLATARALVAARDDACGTRPTDCNLPRVILNKRADIARATGADGVHLGFDAIHRSDARTVLGDAALIGCSLHSVAEVRDAATAGRPVDYVHLAPIWDPNSKKATRRPLGTGALGDACAAGLPVFAQGGVDPERVATALSAGAAGLSVTGALATGADPASVLVPLVKALRAGEKTLSGRAPTD